MGVNTMMYEASDPYALKEDPAAWDEYRKTIRAAGLDLTLQPIAKWDFYKAVEVADHVLTIQTAGSTAVPRICCCRSAFAWIERMAIEIGRSSAFLATISASFRLWMARCGGARSDQRRLFARASGAVDPTDADQAQHLCADVQHDLAENRWALGLAEHHPFIAGVVGWVDLASPACEEQLLEFKDHPRFVGVRHVTQDEQDDDFISQRTGAARPGRVGALWRAVRFTAFTSSILRHVQATLARQLPGVADGDRSFGEAGASRIGTRRIGCRTCARRQLFPMSIASSPA